MDIKEIALKHSREYLTFKLGGRKGLDVEEIVCDDEIYEEIVNELAQQFESIIESYKAELLKEAGEPVAWLFDTNVEALLPDEIEPGQFKERPELYTPLFTSDQVAAAIAKATKQMEDQLAKAEQLWQIAQGRCDGLEEKLAKAEQRVAEWQPIETAPKDGRELILLLTPSNWPQVAYSNTWWISGFSVENKPTHWMPLPKAPANGASS